MYPRGNSYPAHPCCSTCHGGRLAGTRLRLSYGTFATRFTCHLRPFYLQHANTPEHAYCCRTRAACAPLHHTVLSRPARRGCRAEPWACHAWVLQHTPPTFTL